MQKILNLLCVAVSFAIVSCHKDVNPASPAADITGTWNFISANAKINIVQQVTDGSDEVKTVTVNDYVTEKNAGTITFEGTKAVANNLSYSINTNAKSSFYENGVLTDTLSTPFAFTSPVYSGAKTYKRITADSLYFEAGSFFADGASQNSQPGGLRVKLENDKLYLTQTVIQSTTETEQGATVISTVSGISVITLKRQ